MEKKTELLSVEEKLLIFRHLIDNPDSNVKLFWKNDQVTFEVDIQVVQQARDFFRTTQ